MMKKTISIIAIIWGFLCTVLILFVVIDSNQIIGYLKTLPFSKINPTFTGGDLNYTIERDSLKIDINKPVFESLIGKPSNGFVQVAFSGEKSLPPLIEQEIDYNNDTKNDFKVTINTVNNSTKFTTYNPNTKSLMVSSKVHNKWIIRIKIKNEI